MTGGVYDSEMTRPAGSGLKILWLSRIWSMQLRWRSAHSLRFEAEFSSMLGQLRRRPPPPRKTR